MGQFSARQQQMYQTRTHSVEDRIVIIHQPWVRPIVRGKTTAAEEFGAEIAVALYGGYARAETLCWDAFNEGGTLQASTECCKDTTGHYPSRILADKVFRTRDNLDFCKNHGIHLNGPKLGRPPKDRVLYRRHAVRIQQRPKNEAPLNAHWGWANAVTHWDILPRNASIPAKSPYTWCFYR